MKHRTAASASAGSPRRSRKTASNHRSRPGTRRAASAATGGGGGGGTRVAAKRRVRQQGKGSPAAAEVVAGAVATALIQDPVVEPSLGDIIAEEQRLQDETRRAQAQAKSGRAGEDLLTSYMDQLGSIPLFTPEEERRHARDLERLELHTWESVLGIPRAAYLACLQGTDLPDTIYTDLLRLNQSYRRAAARTRHRPLPRRPERVRVIQRTAQQLRATDRDKELLDQVIERVEHDYQGRDQNSEHPIFRLLSTDLQALKRAHQAAVSARNNFVRANLRLVVSVARNFHHYRVPFIDLIQEGNMGLVKAVHRFDHHRGFRFSTYAHWWIRQAIERAIVNKGNQVRLPVHVMDCRRQVAKATARLTQQLGRAPTHQEVAKEMDMPLAKLEALVHGIQPDPVSLDEPLNHEDARSFVDLVHDQEADDVDEVIIKEHTQGHVRSLLHLLSPIEKDVLQRRFGFEEDNDQTLDEIGKSYNLSRERIRQIQAQGISKIRRYCMHRRLHLEGL